MFGILIQGAGCELDCYENGKVREDVYFGGAFRPTAEHQAESQVVVCGFHRGASTAMLILSTL